MNIFNIRRTFEMQKVKNWSETYWCIDLHGTIIPSGRDSNDKIDTLTFYPGAKEVLQWLSARKDIILILWTSTPIYRLVDVWYWLNNNGVYFDFFNNNSHAKNTPRSDFSKKFYFNVLLDDRGSFDPHYDWLLVARELEMVTGESVIQWHSDKQSLLNMGIAKTFSRLNDLIVLS